MCYQKIEKVTLALVLISRKLQRYFLAHVIVVHTNLSLKSVFHLSDLVGRLMKWSIEMSKFGVYYESRKALKEQLFPCTPDPTHTWVIFIDGYPTIVEVELSSS